MAYYLCTGFLNRGAYVYYSSGYRQTLGMLLIGVIRPLLNDSRVPHPLEMPPIEYIPRYKKAQNMPPKEYIRSQYNTP